MASLPEVTGEAAIKVNPYRTYSLTRALEMVLTDERLRQELVAKGLERARQFSWEKAAKETLNIYREVEEE